ncbi:endoribonuclease Dicer [Papilio machaon]|uniref:endoribonuclease Dicer n=1 Tax=Papilio machaon TaxID=76193 RepID=UPI001E662A37|nr:endoribonuclease Dicer [Papilio machaon]
MEEPPSEESLISRSYQTQLEEIALRKNTIIYLPTGSGKTFIAISLIGRFKNSLSGEWGNGAKRTFFLVNTVPLVQQQRKCIMDLCPVKKVAGYSGEDRVDFWNKKKWDEELSNNEVIVMTSQILFDMITHKYINVRDINLLVFDECHHAIDDHPMRMVMKHFEACPKEEQPRVVGLTATLLNSNVTLYKVEESLRQLETTFHATIATVNEFGEVLTYSTNPNEFIVEYRTYKIPIIAEEAFTLLRELKSLIEKVKLPTVERSDVKLKKGQIDISVDPKKIVKQVKNMIVSIEEFITELGIYGGNISIIAYIILLEQLKRKAITLEEENLYRFTITHLVEVRMILSDIMKNETGFERVVRHSSDKVLHLLNILKEYNPDIIKSDSPLKVNCSRQSISAIIFTQKRFSAKILYNLLKEVIEVNPQDFGFLKHDFIVGFNVNPYNNTREQYFTKKQSQQALLKFANKDLNTLIATSVIEEGIDIPQCRLVLRFDPPAEYRSYIQSKGRARSSESAYVILISNENKVKFMRRYEEFQKIEQHVQRMLVGKTDSRDEPTKKDISDNLYNDEDIPTYVTEHGNRLSAQSAIQLLHRYCATLPHDQFTVITPMWIREKLNYRDCEHVLITILLPIASTIKDPIKGKPMFDNKSAKRSAALNACILLHKNGELNEYTLLPESYSRVDFDQVDIKQCFPNWPEHEEDKGNKNVPAVGTKKRIRKHAKVYPEILNGPGSWACGQNTFYLHIIQLKAAFPEPKDSREKALYNFIHRGEGYGFLTSKPLPQLCDFPMFLSVGEVTTSIKINYAKIEIDLNLFEFIKEFHYFIFYYVLEVAKKFLVFDGTKNSMYVVPVKNDGDGYDIDWNVIQHYKDIPPVTVPTLEERKAVNVTRESYQYKVVSPWYRATIFPDRYVVSDVLEYMSPQSLFGSNTFATYANYYSNKYNLEIEGDRHQPLLEVRNISTRMNCLMPRASTIRSFSEKQRKLISAAQGDDKPRGFSEIFIAEFCIKYEFPGVLWYKATILPSILHRVHMLLVAEELRVEIATATKYGQVKLNRGEKWEPVGVDMEVAKKSLLSQVEGPEDQMAALKNTVDRINNPIDESAPRPVTLMSMKDSVYQLQKQKINKEYPWEENMEPIDIDRNLSTVTVMDIECYDEFISAPLLTVPNAVPVDTPNVTVGPHISAAILPPPIVYNDEIDILLREPVGRGPEQKDILTALTTIKSHDNFNLERVETLGDAFLKFAATLYLFHKFPTLNEGQLTNIKGRLIGNRNLYYAGEKMRLGGRMKIEGFSPRTDFVVPGFLAPKEVQKFIEEKGIRPSFLLGMQFPLEDALSGKLSSESIAQIEKRYTECDGVAEQEPQFGAQNSMQCYVSVQVTHDKTVADCVEALVGTYLMHGGVLAGIKVLEWMKIIPKKDNLTSLLTRPMTTVLTTNTVPLTEIDFLLNYSRQEVEEILNYKFNDPALLLEALSHPSYIRNRYTRSYERLEFLGDAVLDFLITSHIFEQCQDFKPGDLTDLRSALVNNVTFAAYVVKLGLQKYLCSQLNPVLGGAIMAFVEHQEQRNHEIVEDILYLIEEEECQIAEYVEVPKTLSDIFESLAGAIYLDSGGSLSTLWAVVYRIMHREIHAFSRSIPRQPVAVLSEMIYACPHFGTATVSKTEQSKVMVPVTFTKDGRQHTVYGVGNNKLQAKRAAAKLALKVLAC